MTTKTKRAKRPVRGGMRVRAYEVLHQALETGIAAGYARAHKHTAKPSEAAVKAEIEAAVLQEICEWFEFDEDGKASDV